MNIHSSNTTNNQLQGQLLPTELNVNFKLVGSNQGWLKAVKQRLQSPELQRIVLAICKNDSPTVTIHIKPSGQDVAVTLQKDELVVTVPSKRCAANDSVPRVVQAIAGLALYNTVVDMAIEYMHNGQLSQPARETLQPLLVHYQSPDSPAGRRGGAAQVLATAIAPYREQLTKERTDLEKWLKEAKPCKADGAEGVTNTLLSKLLSFRAISE